jgi:sensor domain CHASE-containing protein
LVLALVLVVLCLLIAVELRIRNNRAEALRTIIEKELTEIRPKLTVVEQEVLRRLDEIDAKLEGD